MKDHHGGNIYRFAESLGFREEDVVDFSASINPLGVPESARRAIAESVGSLFNYPDPDARDLRLRIAGRIGVEADSIVCGNGSTELIYLLVRALKPRRVLIPAPTFSEYERACETVCSPEIIRYTMDKEHHFDIRPEEVLSLATKDFPCDMAFLCNPNNPTGGLIPRDKLLSIVEGAERAGCVLVVDEAFIDFCPGASIVDEVRGHRFLVVLRSLTKFYALSGLRIGYAVLHDSLMDVVKACKEPWTVNTLAQKAAISVLGDGAYEKKTFEVMEREKGRLEEGFGRLGIAFLPSAANYYLLNVGKGPEVADYLRRQGILVRECSDFGGLDSTYIRVAVKSEEDNMRLLKEIESCVV